MASGYAKAGMQASGVGADGRASFGEMPSARSESTKGAVASTPSGRQKLLEDLIAQGFPLPALALLQGGSQSMGGTATLGDARASQDYLKMALNDSWQQAQRASGGGAPAIPGGGRTSAGRGAAAEIRGETPAMAEGRQRNIARRERQATLDQDYSQNAREAALGFQYQQKQSSLKSQLAQKLLSGILGIGGKDLGGPQTTTQDTQQVSMVAGAPRLVPIHSTETRTPGGSDRAQMMAQLLQAFQGYV
jgi:hypothetical protein